MTSERATVSRAIDVDIDAKFIEQEHRLFRVIVNWLNRKDWPVGDPRRNAAASAIVLRLILSPTTLVAGGALLGIMSLAAILYQNHLIAEQNRIALESIRGVLAPVTECRVNLLSQGESEKATHIRPLLLISNSGDLPVAVNQIAIVNASYSEPIPSRLVSGEIIAEEGINTHIIPPKSMKIVVAEFSRAEIVEQFELDSNPMAVAVVRSLFYHDGQGMIWDELAITILLAPNNEPVLLSSETGPILPANEDKLPVVKVYP